MQGHGLTSGEKKEIITNSKQNILEKLKDQVSVAYRLYTGPTVTKSGIDEAISIFIDVIILANTTLNNTVNVKERERLCADISAGLFHLAQIHVKYKKHFNHIPHELISIIKGLWERLKSEADKQITDHQNEMNVLVDEIKRSLHGECERRKNLESQLHQVENQMHAEKNHSETLQQSIEEEKRSNAKLSERNDRLSESLANQKSENNRLHALLTHLQNNLEHYQSSIQKLREEQVLSMEKQKTQYEQEIIYLKKEIAGLGILKERLTLENHQYQSEIKQLSDQNTAIIYEKNQYQQELQEKMLNEKLILTQRDALKEDNIQYQTQLQQQLAVINEHEKKIAVLQDQILHLTKLQDTSENTIRLLREEQLFLAQEKSQLEGQLKQIERMLLAQASKIV